MSVLDRPSGWAGANFVPLVLIPLAALLVWVGDLAGLAPARRAAAA